MTAPDITTVDELGIIELIATAVALTEKGEAERALELYGRWLRHLPDHPFRHTVYFNQGFLLFECGHIADAATAYAEVIRIAPNFLPAYINAGLTFERLDRLDQAAAQWLHVANLVAPVDNACLTNKASALRHLGRVFQSVRDYAQAEEAFQRCLEIDPHQPDVIQHWISLRQMQCKWPVIDPTGGLTQSILVDALSPLALAIHTDDPMFQLANAWRHARSIGVGPTKFHTSGRWSAPAMASERRLRIGYVSPDLRGHAVGFLTAELFELHDRANVEVFAYYSGRNAPDATQDRIRHAADHWRTIATLLPQHTARLIVQDGIDILIDLGGHTNGAPTAAFALRPAPVVVNWLGYPGSMGTPHHQYIIADNEIIPPSHEKYYTERVVRLPCYQPTDRKRVVADPAPSRGQAGLPDGTMVYCCFNGAQKITQVMFQCWMKILANVPNSILWLLSCDAATDERLRQRAAGCGIAPGRLVFAERQLNADHLARYKLADLFLDTAPYGAHTTASDALWMGVPVLTIAGHSFASRVCASLVRAAKMPELVCDDLAAYSHQAIKLGRRPDIRTGLRERLRVNRDNCTLFNMPLLVTRLETLYQQMWDDYLTDRLPEPDLTNLGIYHDIGAELGDATADVADLRTYEHRYTNALAYRHSISPLPHDSRLWLDRGPGGSTCLNGAQKVSVVPGTILV